MLPRITELTIWLPLPPRELHQNARGHWSARHRSVAQYRETAMLAAQAAFMPAAKPKWRAATATITMNFHTKNRRDPTNFLAALKSGWDGFVDAGLLIDDDQLRPQLPEFTVDKSQPAGVTICIKEQP